MKFTGSLKGLKANEPPRRRDAEEKLFYVSCAAGASNNKPPRLCASAVKFFIFKLMIKIGIDLGGTKNRRHRIVRYRQ